MLSALVLLAYSNTWSGCSRRQLNCAFGAKKTTFAAVSTDAGVGRGGRPTTFVLIRG